MPYYPCILRCADESLYVGHAQNLDARLKAHNDGRGAEHMFKHRPVPLIYSEAFASKHEAVLREQQLKRWSHGKKEALVQGNLQRLKLLSSKSSEIPFPRPARYGLHQSIRDGCPSKLIDSVVGLPARSGPRKSVDLQSSQICYSL